MSAAWIRENATIASLLSAVVAVIAAVAVGWYQLSGLVAQQPEIQRHLYDDSRHVSPEEQKEMKDQIKEMERRLRNLEERQWRRHIDSQRGPRR